MEIKNNKPGMRENPYNDLSQWEMPIYYCESIRDAVDGGFPSDGIYRISLDRGCVLDVLVQNMASVVTSGSVLIGLNGAVTQREKKKGPFFSGTSITKGMGTPSISISDPSLDIDGKVGLAWYAGNEMVPDLPLRIAEIINGFADRYSVRPILFGGSGAGFAALNISTYLSVSHTALVWNPQTRIVKYFARFVEKYLKSAFPRLWSKMYTRAAFLRSDPEPFLKSVLDRSGVSHSLEGKRANQLAQVLYLQNRDDWHVVIHADPYLRQFGSWRRIGSSSFIAENIPFGVVFGNWGKGHVAPPREVIYQLLEFCTANSELFSDERSNIFSLFAKDSYYQWDLCDFDRNSSAVRETADEVEAGRKSHTHEGTLELNVVYSDSTSTVLAELNTYSDSVAEKEGTYAFYLLQNGTRVQTRWYERKPYVTFEVKNIVNAGGELEVVAFSKSKSGVVKRVRRMVSIG